MKKLLLTGASGFLGYNFLQADLSQWQVIGITHERPLSFSFVKSVQCNLADSDAVRNILNATQPDAVVHLAALSNALYCEENPGISHQVNVEATLALTAWCAEAKIPFVFTSTDLVFDGTKGNYAEDDAVNPLSLYGRQKAEAEKNIFNIYTEACVLRMPLMFGYGGQHAQSFMQGFLQKMKQGESLRLFTDEYRSIAGGKSAAQGILLALENNWKGIFHLGGKEKISRYDFGKMMCEAFDISTQLIIPSLQKDVPLVPPRPADVSLNSNKAYQKGYNPLPIEEELKLVADLL